MKDKQLKLFKYTWAPELDGVAFPSEAEQIIINDFKYTATRMGAAPTITATINTPARLSTKWYDKVYTIFDGEVFFVKGAPTHSKDEKSVAYKYNVEFVSKRVVLENTHFFDVEETDGPQGEKTYYSHGCDFSFYGSIGDFCKKVNLCMKYYDFGYRLFVDSDRDTNYSRSLDFTGVTLYDAICSISDAFGLPFVFQKSEIIFTDCIDKYDWSLYYGEDNRGELGGLLSISRSVDRGDIITSITGYGSDKNIPYYYPNPTPKGTLKLGGKSAEKYEITNQMLFCEAVALEKPIYYKKGWPSLSDEWKVTRDFSETRYNGDFLYIEEGNAHLIITYPVTIYVHEDGDYTSSIIPIQLHYEVVSNGYWWNPVVATVNAELTDNSSEKKYSLTSYSMVIKEDTDNNVFEGVYAFDTGVDITYSGTREYTLTLDIYVGDMAEYQIGFKGSVLSAHEWKEMSGIYYYSYNDKMTATGTAYIDSGSVGPFVIKGEVTVDGTVYSLSDVATSVEFHGWNGSEKIIYKQKSGDIAVPMLDVDTYDTIMHFNTLDSNVDISNVSISPKVSSRGVWCYEDGDIIPNADIGIAVKSDKAQNNNDNIIQEISYRINTQSRLRIPRYVEFQGYRELYDTTSDPSTTYPNATDIINPKQYIYRTDEIFPTIEGMTNANGLRVDMFRTFAYDENDNDEVYPEDYEIQDLAGKYKHPYFYAKLRKTDSNSAGFNLFDSAISGSPMTVTFNTGKCGGCSFTVGVDEETGTFNPVQVDSNGNLLRDVNGNVIRRGRKQLRQNDTQNYEVWVALKKDDSTFGVLMPSAKSSMRPSTADEFVITGIRLPDAYIRAAESRLEESMLKYMREYNDYKYAYNVNVSRIFYEQNSTSGFGYVNENYKVQIHDGGLKELYVKTFTYSMSSSSPLPEVSLTLCEDISPKVNTIAGIKKEIHNTATNLKMSQVAVSEKLTRNVLKAKTTSNSGIFKASALAAASLSNVKQDSLNRDNFKTINGESIIISDYGDTNIEITGGGGINKEALNLYINGVTHSYDGSVTKSISLFAPEGPPQRSGQIAIGINANNVEWSDIKTINGISILGSGNIQTLENLSIMTIEEDIPKTYILRADTIFVFTQKQTQGSVFTARISDLEDENEHKWGVRFKVADNNTGSYNVTSDVPISWKDGRTFTAQNGGYYDVLLHYKDGVIYGEYSAYGDITMPTDAYIADFTLQDITDTENDTPIDYTALEDAWKNKKTIIIRDIGAIVSHSLSYFVVSGIVALPQLGEDPESLTIKINCDTKVYIAKAKGGSINAIKASDKRVKTLVTDDVVVNNVSDVYIADFKLSDMAATVDKPIDFASLLRAMSEGKVILISSGRGSYMVATTTYEMGLGRNPSKIYISVTDGTIIYNSTALSDSASIKSSENTKLTIATEQYVTNVVGDINTLLETIIAG